MAVDAARGETGQRRFDLVGEGSVGFELVGELFGVDAYAAPDEAEQHLQCASP